MLSGISAIHSAPLAADMVTIPTGIFQMGSQAGESAERPVHEVRNDAFAIDRHEMTNAEFAAFVAATRHVSDAERSGFGWHWEGTWEELAGARWRNPRGPASSIEGLDRHPVVQVSWHDARAYCHWRGKRLPTEGNWVAKSAEPLDP